MGVVVETQRIIPLHEVQILPLVQHGECERALDRFRHVFKAGKVEGIFLLKELDGYIAVRLDPWFRQVLGAAKNAVVPKYAVVRKSERFVFRVAEERVIISILPRIALCGHTGMAHDGPAVCRNTEPRPVCRYGALVDAQMPVRTVRDAGSVSAALFTFRRQYGEDVTLLLGTELVPAVDQTE